MQQNLNNNIFTIAGVKHDGKTTVGKYLVEFFNQPTIIIDIAKQFEANTPYRMMIKGIKEFSFYFSNQSFLNAFKKGKFQVIYRFIEEDETKETHELFRMINKLKNICIFCEEMELYADSYLRKSHSIFKTMYLSRNRNFTIIIIIKEISSLNKMIRNQTDFFILGRIRDPNAIKYFDERSNKKFTENIKNVKFREFIITDLVDTWKVFSLKPNTIKLIK